jgi:tetratricopeptide (TPR) repeat protein
MYRTPLVDATLLFPWRNIRGKSLIALSAPVSHTCAKARATYSAGPPGSHPNIMASERVFPCSAPRRADPTAVSAARPVPAPLSCASHGQGGNPLARKDGSGGARRRASSSLRALGARGLSLLALAFLATGCSELQARHYARGGNSRFLDGDYAGALREYELAEQKFPGIAVVQLNKGLACSRMMAPGSKSPEQQRAVDCALDSFTKFKELSPTDPRGDQLYIQTLFDGDRWDTLVAMYEKQLEKDPKNMAAINGLISVHSRADHWNDTLKWTIARADIDDKDAEEQYAVGAMIFNRLYQKGGADKAAYDPRPDPNEEPPKPVKKKKKRGKHAKAEPPPPPSKMAPPFSMGDVVGAERIRLADIGLKYLQRALDLRPNYREAIGFMSLVYRQKSFAYLEQPTLWEPLFNLANEWMTKANQMGTPAPAPAPADAPAPAPEAAAKP